MAIAFVRAHNDFSGTTPGTIVEPQISSTVASVAGNLLAFIAEFNNTSATAPTVTSISKPGGETASWVKLASVDSASAIGSAGTRIEIWGIKTTISWPTSTFVTGTISPTTTARLGKLLEFSGASTTVRDSQTTNNVSGTSPSVTSTAPVSGDLIIGVSGMSTATGSWTADSDTTNGNWSSDLGLLVGTGTGQHASIQYKIVNATGSQTYNTTYSIADSYSAVLAVIQSDVTNISLSRIFKWNVKASISLSRIFKWNVLANISTSRIFKWNVLATVSTSRIFKWNVRTAVAPFTRTFKWNVIGGVLINRVFKWNVLQTITPTRTFKWNVRVAVAPFTRTFKWNVRVQVLTSRVFQWNVIQTITASRIFKWNVRQALSTSRTFKWNVTGFVQIARTFLWDVFVPWTKVSKSVDDWTEIPEPVDIWTELERVNTGWR